MLLEAALMFEGPAAAFNRSFGFLACPVLVLCGSSLLVVEEEATLTGKLAPGAPIIASSLDTTAKAIVSIAKFKLSDILHIFSPKRRWQVI